jgi:hypothetical protein
MLRSRGRYGGLLVERGTELVIEGFPRSANTFAVAAMWVSQGRRPVMARHTHTPAQIMRASRLRIPAILLVRRPADAIVSLMVREPRLGPRQALRSWVRFHEAVMPYAGDVVVAGFEEVTTDFGAVIERVNARFGTSFLPFEHTGENLDRCNAVIEELDRRDTGRDGVTSRTVARPDAERDEQSKAARAELARVTKSRIYRRAEEIYRTMIRFQERHEP